jgi:hyperosmotically inducible periplasmic protein
MPRKVIEEEREEYDPDVKVDPRVEPRYSRVDRTVPAKRSWYRGYIERDKHGPSFLSILLGLLVAGAIAAGVYYYYYGHRSWRSDLTTLSEGSKDAATTAAVKTSIELNKQLSDDSISVDTNNGVVSLNGQVNSMEDKQRAEEVARNTRGVQEVVNNLAVTTAGKNEQRVEDLEIQTKVVEAIYSNDSLRGQDIKARVDNKVVNLEGRVNTQEQKDTALAAAQRVSGVSKVEDNIQVNNLQPVAPPPSQPLQPVQ